MTKSVSCLRQLGVEGKVAVGIAWPIVRAKPDREGKWHQAGRQR